MTKWERASIPSDAPIFRVKEKLERLIEKAKGISRRLNEERARCEQELKRG